MVEHLRKKPDKAQIEARTNGELKRLVYDTLDPADFSKEVLALSTERLLVESCGEVGWSDLGEPRRFIEALTENGAENPWAVAELCNMCGLTREQIVTLSGHSDARAAIEETATLASLD